jgi:hypothetical protein
MTSENTPAENRLLASVLALVGGYYAIRASLQLPKFHRLLAVTEEIDHPLSFGNLILSYPHWYLTLVIVTLLATLIAIWHEFGGHKFIYCIGIVLLFVLTERAVASFIDPIVRMMSTLSQ